MTLRLKYGLLLVFFMGYGSMAQNNDQRNQQLDVQHYRFSFELNDTTDLVQVVADVQILFKADLQSFELDLVAYDDWTGKGMTVSSIIHKKKAQKFEQEEELLRFLLKKRVWKGETHDFQIRYSGIPEEGLIITRNKFNDRVFFGENWPDRAKNWLVSNDHPSDKATIEFIIKAPDHYDVIANGALVKEEREETGYITSYWREDVPLPTKVMVIGVAPFSVDSAGMVEDIPVTTWVFPQNAQAGFVDFKPAVGILEYFIDKIGPYPYNKLANVQSKTRFGGMENAGNIFYFENSVTGNRERDYLIAHEIAHQWFGNSATEASWHHVWLSEGFATYLTNLYAEDTYGSEVLAERMNEQRAKVVAFSKTRLAPVIDRAVKDYEELLNANSYQKGSWFLHMLRRQVGEEQFIKGIRQYYTQYGGKNAFTEDFQRVMEVVSGQSLGSFFQQWLYRAGHPVLSFDWQLDENTDELILNIRQQQEDLFQFPLELRLVRTEGDDQYDQVMVTQRSQTFRLPATSDISALDIDPAVWLLHEVAED